MGAAEDSEGVPLRCRTVLVLLNLTDEVQEVELSGLCWWQLKSWTLWLKPLLKKMLETGYGGRDESCRRQQNLGCHHFPLVRTEKITGNQFFNTVQEQVCSYQQELFHFAFYRASWMTTNLMISTKACWSYQSVGKRCREEAYRFELSSGLFAGHEVLYVSIKEIIVWVWIAISPGRTCRRGLSHLRRVSPKDLGSGREGLNWMLSNGCLSKSTQHHGLRFGKEKDQRPFV